MKINSSLLCLYQKKNNIFDDLFVDCFNIQKKNFREHFEEMMEHGQWIVLKV
jgi:hypothetical protein